LGSHILDLYGKLRGYSASLGVMPGTNATFVHADAITMTPGTAGRLRVVGASRTLASGQEWGTSSAGDEAIIAALEVAAAPDAIIDVEARMQASDWTITSGTLRSSKLLQVGRGVPNDGDFTVGPQATVVFRTTTLSGIVVGPSSGYGGSLTVYGKLEVISTGSYVNMRSVQFENVVEYTGNTQILLRAAIDNGVRRYRDLVLTGSGVKTLPANTTVTGSLTLNNKATVSTQTSFVVSYEPGAKLIYAGTELQTTGAELPGTAAVVPDLHVANPAGIKLTKNVEVTGQLLLDGSLDASTKALTLGPQATCGGIGDVTGTVLRSSLPAAGTYCFGNPNVQITLPEGSTLPGSISVKLTRGATPFMGAVRLRYQITAEGFAGSATLRLPFDNADLNGNDPLKLQLWRYSGSTWTLQGATARGVDAEGKAYVEKSGVVGFSDWTLAAAGTPTAVTVSSFSARLVNGQRWLTWQTASELDCLGFAIYRSYSAAARGEHIADVTAQAPGSPRGAEYAWQDVPGPSLAEPPGAVIYYWLDVIDQAAGVVPEPQGARLRLPAVYLPVLQK
jgi:hypothetical protein